MPSSHRCAWVHLIGLHLPMHCLHGRLHRILWIGIPWIRLRNHLRCRMRHLICLSSALSHASDGLWRLQVLRCDRIHVAVVLSLCSRLLVRLPPYIVQKLRAMSSSLTQLLVVFCSLRCLVQNVDRTTRLRSVLIRRPSDLLTRPNHIAVSCVRPQLIARQVYHW